MSDVDDILDFGAGRGWFLRKSREFGVRRGASADTSALAATTAREDGFAAVILPRAESTEGIASALQSLPFRPRIITFMDVIEHFSPSRLEEHVRGIVDSLRPELEVVVIKVPVADGVLHQSASVAAWLRFPAPLEQLYQVGTYPPHYSYFTKRSLHRLVVRNLGWEVLALVDDPDFEPDALTDRILVLHRLPSGPRKMIGRLLGEVIGRTPRLDTQILIARV